MISRFRNSFAIKVFVCLTVMSITGNIVFPGVAYALTGGPEQPGVQGFEPAGTTEMVDIFTGDFKYNIPLFSIGGYPINLNYNGNVNTDMEAGWVGLGWSLNPGSVNRSVRGLPDEFNGDVVTKTYSVKDMHNLTVEGSLGAEIIGLEHGLGSIGPNLELGYNNYSGISCNYGLGIDYKSNDFLSAGAQVSTGTNGLNVSPSVSLTLGEEKNYKANVSSGYNSRAGLSSFNFGSKIVGPFHSFGSQISFGTPSYLPVVQHPKNNFSASFNIKLGGEFLALFTSSSVMASYSTQRIKDEVIDYKGFGYVHSPGVMYNNPSHLMDINREKDGVMTPEVPNLPLGYQTYDVFSVNTEAGGGAFRPKLNSVGVISDTYVEDGNNNDMSLSFELGGGGTSHFGSNISASEVVSRSGRWLAGGNVSASMNYDHEYADNSQPFGFVKQGNLFDCQLPSMFLNDMYDAVAFPLVSLFAVSPLPGDNSLNEKYQQSEYLDCRYVSEAGACLESDLHFYDINMGVDENFSMQQSYDGYYRLPSTSVSRSDYSPEEHHFTEFTFVNTAGQRSVFGLPVYNRSKKEVSFSTAQAGNEATGLVNIGSGENTLNNESGNEHMISIDETPPYATSYMLTAVLSPDYSDNDNIEGPSDGDNGSYVKFDYAMDYDYKWRVPYSKANYDRGLMAKNNDDKAHYIYGEKDVCYLKAIESKDRVAIFYVSDINERNDGYEAKQETENNASLGADNMRQLDSIQVFSKQSLIDLSNDAVPEKTIVFVYAGSGLCPEIDNASDPEAGKLTLEKLYIKYGETGQGRLSPYEFSYNQTYISPGDGTSDDYSYHLKNYDRWGSYSENKVYNPDDVLLYTTEFPYTSQEVTSTGGTTEFLADRYAGAWLLNNIKLPTGGEISIEYEADDYAYVQDRRAMQMMRLVGTYSSSLAEDISTYLGEENITANNQLYASAGLNVYDYLIFELPVSVTSQYSNDEAGREKLLSDLLKDENGQQMEFMYYKFLMTLSGNRQDYVNGYAELDDFSNHVVNLGSRLVAIRIKPVDVQDAFAVGVTHPITQNSINFCKKYYGDIAYGTPDIEEGELQQMINAMLSVLISAPQALIGVSRSMLLLGKCREFDPQKSWIRLYNPIRKKKGGGSRVKRLEMSDNWSDMLASSTEMSSSFGQMYDYTIQDTEHGQISSGVASYEPVFGGDENPFRQPVSYTTKKILTADEENYLEEPFGESFFPSPVVGYSKVTVKPIIYEDAAYTSNRPGYSVREFYTAKDFPVIVKYTDKESEDYEFNLSIGLFKKYEKMLTESQGYVIVKNDMHGKPKKNSSLNSEGSPVSMTSYYYKTNSDGSLSSEITSINAENEISTIDNAGVLADVYVDMREHVTNGSTHSNSVNTDVFLAGVVPGLFFMMLPGSVSTRNEYRSAVITKVVEQTGILDRVVNWDEGSEIAQNNLLYDMETGEVLLTETFNEFDDAYYSFSYPAHWMYPGVRPEFTRLGWNVYTDISNGSFSGISNLHEGDKLLLKTDGLTMPAWVTLNGSDEKVLIDKYGGQIQNITGVDILLTDPVETNQLGLKSGSVVCKANPVTAGGLVFSDVVNTEALLYSDEAQLDCNCAVQAGDNYNPYVEGEKGLFKPWQTYYFLSERTQRSHSSQTQEMRTDYNTYLRDDGVLESYIPFWEYTSGWSMNDDVNFDKYWKKASEVTKYSARGKELENKNALDIFSSAVFGYNDQYPVMVSGNAKHRNVAFDGFEDYGMTGCEHSHFHFESGELILAPYAHTGAKAIKLLPNTRVELTKDLDNE